MKKLKYLLLIPVLLLAFFCSTASQIILPKEKQWQIVQVPQGRTTLMKVLLPQQTPIQPLSVQMDSAWLPLLQTCKITSSDYFVYDLDAQEYLILSSDVSKPIYPASTTKLFSAYVALRYIDADEVITVGSELSLVDPASSVAGLQRGDRVTVRQLVAAMMLPSGNDATYVLATNVGRIIGGRDLSAKEAVAMFVKMMNIQAQTVGLSDTKFITPDGFHAEGHYICMGDYVRICELALNDTVISSCVGQDRLTLQLGDRVLELKNTNLLLHENSRYYLSYAQGLKTGYTSQAGNCLLSVCQQGNRRLLIGVFGCPDHYARFAETLLLFTQAVGLKLPEAPYVTGFIKTCNYLSDKSP